MKIVFIDLKKLIDVVNKEVVQNKKLNTLKTKVNKLYRKILDVTILMHINQYNTDKQSLKIKIGAIDKKLVYLIDLMTTTVLDVKIKAVDNKVADLSGLVKKTDYDTKILEANGK